MSRNKFTDLSKSILPSNIKFGFFFTAIFLLTAVYLYFEKLIFFSYLFVFIAIVFLLTTIIKPSLLFPLNKFWMIFANFLGRIISPIVLGLIYFGLLSPIAFIFKIFGRDELILRIRKKDSYWIERKPSSHNESFKNQF
tara:strand:- start:4211 stop:4627 length:417 start_codon:yes stop_codon:yes gene_type:complete